MGELQHEAGETVCGGSEKCEFCPWANAAGISLQKEMLCHPSLQVFHPTEARICHSRMEPMDGERQKDARKSARTNDKADM